jgi:hypothetical protein
MWGRREEKEGCLGTREGLRLQKPAKFEILKAWN